MTRWYRAYEGTVTDAKLAEASLIAEISRSVVIATWHSLLESCAATNDRGRFDTSPRRVAAILVEPVPAIDAVFAAFTSLGMIEAGRVVAWTSRQFESDSSTERSRKHRDAKRSGDLARGNVVERDGDVLSSPVQRCTTVPETETDNPLPLPLSSARDPENGIGDFDRFWQAMPKPDPAARASAQAAFARLAPLDKAHAIVAAGQYAAKFAEKPTTHPISPTRFLGQRCFEGYPPASAALAGRTVFVKVDTPQWRAWTAYRGKSIPTNKEGTGWCFPSEWPPILEAERGAA